MLTLLQRLCDCLDNGMPVASATIISHSGSTPRTSGSKLLASAQGLIAGTTGGGLAEAWAITACQEALADKKSRVLECHMDGKLAAKSDLICGGRIRLFIEPHFPNTHTKEHLHSLLEHASTHGAYRIVSLDETEKDCHAALYSNGLFLKTAFSQTLVAKCHTILENNFPTSRLPIYDIPPFLHHIEGEEYFFEAWLPPHHIIFAGGGHVSRPTAHIAHLSGFRVSVMDDREEFVTAERFPSASARYIVPEYANCFASCTVNARTYFVILTRGHLFDRVVLEQALQTQAGYIGMIGSARKRNEIYAQLREAGYRDHELSRVHCPIGLSIEAETPEEIAVSIIAQCIAHKRQASCV